MSRNVALIAARTARNLSQEELARELGVDRRTYQRWEQDASVRPQGAHVRKLQQTMGLAVEQLGFPLDKSAMVVDDGRGGHDLEVRFPPMVSAPSRPPAGDYSGIWLSRYEFFSSSRGQHIVCLHHVVLEQDGGTAKAHSLPNSASSLVFLDLKISGTVFSGTWAEDTDRNGHYKGVQYTGAIHLLADPSGLRLSGKWLGHGKENEVNSGPWILDRQAAVNSMTVAQYDRPPND
jgi:transcriptional regulator with XRE-family HTH domain